MNIAEIRAKAPDRVWIASAAGLVLVVLMFFTAGSCSGGNGAKTPPAAEDQIQITPGHLTGVPLCSERRNGSTRDTYTVRGDQTFQVSTCFAVGTFRLIELMSAALPSVPAKTNRVLVHTPGVDGWAVCALPANVYGVQFATTQLNCPGGRDER